MKYIVFVFFLTLMNSAFAGFTQKDFVFTGRGTGTQECIENGFQLESKEISYNMKLARNADMMLFTGEYLKIVKGEIFDAKNKKVGTLTDNYIQLTTHYGNSDFYYLSTDEKVITYRSESDQNEYVDLIGNRQAVMCKSHGTVKR